MLQKDGLRFVHGSNPRGVCNFIVNHIMLRYGNMKYVVIQVIVYHRIKLTART